MRRAAAILIPPIKYSTYEKQYPGSTADELLDAAPLPLRELVDGRRLRAGAETEAAHHAHAVQGPRLQQRQLLDVLGQAPVDAPLGADVALPAHGPAGHGREEQARSCRQTGVPLPLR